MPMKKAQEPPHKKGKKRGCLIAVVAIVLIAVIAGAVSRCNSGPKGFDWPSSGLATMLPKPKSTKGEIYANDDDRLSIDVANTSESDFADYVEQCKEKGFTVDAGLSGSTFTAFSKEGHELRVSLLSDEMGIDLNAPVELGDLSWPTTEPGSLAPAPASKKGKVETDNSTTYSARVGDTSADDYSAYVDSCIKAGFDVDYDRGDKFFTANNSNGASLRVDYEGFNTMLVTVKAPEKTDDAAETEPTPEPEAKETKTESKESSDSVSPSFKETMDSYEQFMNEYVEFMKKYDSSDDPLSMAADYTSMMARYADMTTKYGSIDEGSLSAADSAYYLEVQARVTKKLAEIGE